MAKNDAVMAKLEEINAKLDQLLGAPKADLDQEKRVYRPAQDEKLTTTTTHMPKEAKPPKVETFVPKNGKLTPEITIEQLRETATQYTKVFGIEDLLKLNQKFGGAKKLAEVPPEQFGMLYEEMQARLKADKPKEEETIDIGKVRDAATTFMKTNGAPALGALLDAFKAKKLSELPADSYAAFLEALDNAS